ncbi:MAG: hypothetical protein KDG50_12265 [Chromatiales bacterium]|nr:hypothetical protein [Chromatiales bacterium]
MEPAEYRPGYARNVLIAMLLGVVLAVGIVIWQWPTIASLYIQNQLTDVGLVINGAIFLLLAAGLVRLAVILMRLNREEGALARLRDNLFGHVEDPLRGVEPESVAGRRYAMLRSLHERNAAIEQGAIAATLAARENRAVSFPRYVHNVLILTGVFGTIVSLSIALLGASDLLETSVNVGGMGLMIHGMSTALATTVSAILSYLFFSWFFIKTTDAQSRFVTALEQLTTQHLLPRFKVQTETVLYEFSGLIRSLQGLVEQMLSSQKQISQIETRLAATTLDFHARLKGVTADMGRIKQLLRDGFRLPSGE